MPTDAERALSAALKEIERLEEQVRQEKIANEPAMGSIIKVQGKHATLPSYLIRIGGVEEDNDEDEDADLVPGVWTTSLDSPGRTYCNIAKVLERYKATTYEVVEAKDVFI